VLRSLPPVDGCRFSPFVLHFAGPSGYGEVSRSAVIPTPALLSPVWGVFADSRPETSADFPVAPIGRIHDRTSFTSRRLLGNGEGMEVLPTKRHGNGFRRLVDEFGTAAFVPSFFPATTNASTSLRNQLPGGLSRHGAISWPTTLTVTQKD